MTVQRIETSDLYNIEIAPGNHPDDVFVVFRLKPEFLEPIPGRNIAVEVSLDKLKEAVDRLTEVTEVVA